MDGEEEVCTVVNSRYHNRQGHKTTIYEPTLQRKWYKDYSRATLINCGKVLAYKRTKEENLNRY